MVTLEIDTKRSKIPIEQKNTKSTNSPPTRFQKTHKKIHKRRKMSKNIRNYKTIRMSQEKSI